MAAAYARTEDLTQDAAALKLRSALDMSEDAEEPTVDERPAIVLVASAFRPEVTATVLWLTDEYGLDIECVTLTAHKVGQETVLSTQTLLPLPSAEEFQIRRQHKKASAAAKPATKVDWERVKEVVASIPQGHWMTYHDLAVAGGSPRAAMAVGQWLAKSEDVPLDCAHRVLKSGGSVAKKFSGRIGGREKARERLEAEGLTFGEGGHADPAKRWTPPPSDAT